MSFRKRNKKETVFGDLVLEHAMDLSSDSHVIVINWTCSV